MNALYVRLPLVDLIPEHMRDTETQSSLSSMLEVLQEAFKFVIKFSNTPTNSKSYILSRGSDLVLMSVCAIKSASAPTEYD